MLHISVRSCGDCDLIVPYHGRRKHRSIVSIGVGKGSEVVEKSGLVAGIGFVVAVAA